MDRVVDLVGIDHIGIGSDYDGIPRLPKGLEDVSTYPKFIKELLVRGYSDEDIKKIPLQLTEGLMIQIPCSLVLGKYDVERYVEFAHGIFGDRSFAYDDYSNLR